MMMLGITGSRMQCRALRRQVRALLRDFGAVHAGTRLGDKWAHSRFTAPYLRESLWRKGYVVDTLETATDWDNVDNLLARIEHNLRTATAAQNERVHAYTHLSHMYTQGCSIYTTYMFRCTESYEKTLALWRTLKHTTSEIIVANGGTISHQHGVGKDHAPYLATEKGRLGMFALKNLVRGFDPDQRLNPGTLLSD